MKGLILLTLAGAALVNAAASADFAGQTLLGPITAGSFVTGTTVGASDDNDGWFSGTHVFDLWDGGDEVYQLNWAGGDLHLQLTYDNAVADLDLFLYTPGSLDETSIDSLFGTGVETINLSNAAAGTYFVLIDSPFGQEGAYELSVIVPAPGAAAMLGLGLLGCAGRRRTN